MPWITPVTDRNESAPGQNAPADWQRQNGNTEYIATETLPALYYFPEYTAAALVDMEDYPFEDVLNLLEQNIAAIEASGVPLPPDWEEAKTWVAGGAAPDWQDANRWERNVLLIWEMAERVRAAWLPLGTFECGGILI